MIEPSEQERRALNEALARAMGYHTMSQIFGDSVLWFLCSPDGLRISVTCWDDESDCWEDAPDFTRDASASRELVLWLAGQGRIIQGRFVRKLRDDTIDVELCYELRILTADPLLIAQAAREAIGGNDGR